MIINYVHCQMLSGSNKQASEFTVPGSLRVPINSVRVTVLNKMAPSPEQKPQMVHFWIYHRFFFPMPLTWAENTLSGCYSKEPPRLSEVVGVFGWGGVNRTLWPTRAKFGLQPVDFISSIFWTDGLPGTDRKTTEASQEIFISKYIFQKNKDFERKMLK